jgi:hypothetical protein
MKNGVERNLVDVWNVGGGLEALCKKTFREDVVTSCCASNF